MREVTFMVRVLTPLFLSGNDQTTAEVRGPSMRGLMRYWYRALIGGIIGAHRQTLPQVKAAEADLFGATDKGSAVAVRVSAASEKFIEWTGAKAGTGKSYLLWSMARSNKKEARKYFPAGTHFHVTLSTQGTSTARLEQAIAAFWLFTHLGGLGARSRRCAGSIAVQPVEGYQTAFPFAQAANIQQLKLQLEQGIKIAREVARQSLDKSTQNTGRQMPAPQAEFDTLAKGTCRIWILQDTQPWFNSESVMTALGESLRMYRGGIAIGKRVIFGLPLPPLTTRRASPLLLRVVELQDTRYAGIAVLFKTAASDIQPADYIIIENWIATFPGAMEVAL